jgi:hypothetical protein
MCPSYPPYFAVPTLCSDTLLLHAARFRAHGRIPALSFIHPQTGAPLLRSSQPCPGLTNRRSIQDERLIEAACMVSNTASGLRDLLIVDARPTTSALANAVQGRGSEHVDFYGGSHRCSKVHLSLPNIHSVREWAREARSGASNNWSKGLAKLICGAEVIVEALAAGKAVLVHCSDGWDRTPQLTSLVAILCDPHYRRDEGLVDLVAREWIWMGHRFSTRCGHFLPPGTEDNSNEGDLEETSPTFCQFLHCIRILKGRDPDGFIGISDGLIRKLESAAYRPDGPMAGDCERDRQKWNLPSFSIHS